MSNLNHPNVMKLIGVCIDKQNTPYIVMPYMSLGSLLSYLRRNREELTVNTNEENPDIVSEFCALPCEFEELFFYSGI